HHARPNLFHAVAKFGPAIDLAQLMLGAFLMLAPSMFQWTAFPLETWSDRMFGLILALLAVLSFAGYWRWREWASLTLGVWIAASPWLTVKSATEAQLAVHMAVGAAIALLAAAELRYLHPPARRP